MASLALSAEVQAFIETCRVAHLATTDHGRRPHVIPVCFAYTIDALWTAIDEKPKNTTHLKRIRNIEQNPQVALVFDYYDEDWKKLAYVLVTGTASIADAHPHAATALSVLRERYPQYREMKLEGRPLIRVEARSVASWGALRR